MQRGGGEADPAVVAAGLMRESPPTAGRLRAG